MNRNGIDLGLLHGTVEGIRQHPEAGTGRALGRRRRRPRQSRPEHQPNLTGVRLARPPCTAAVARAAPAIATSDQ